MASAAEPSWLSQRGTVTAAWALARSVAMRSVGPPRGALALRVVEAPFVCCGYRGE